MADGIEVGDRLLVIFDGYCGFCNMSVRWFLRRDRLDRMRFVPSESPLVTGLLARHGLGGPGSRLGLDTIVVVRDAGGENERVFTRSNAAREMLRELPEPWQAAGVVFGWVPQAVRDVGYRVIARWRYRIWGRLESCPLPRAEERGRFL